MRLDNSHIGRVLLEPSGRWMRVVFVYPEQVTCLEAGNQYESAWPNPLPERWVFASDVEKLGIAGRALAGSGGSRE